MRQLGNSFKVAKMNIFSAIILAQLTVALLTMSTSNIQTRAASVFAIHLEDTHD